MSEARALDCYRGDDFDGDWWDTLDVCAVAGMTRDELVDYLMVGELFILEEAQA